MPVFDMVKSVVTAAIFILCLLAPFSAAYYSDFAPEYSILRRRSLNRSLCSELIQPLGYPCSEHRIQTKDGYLLGLQRVSSRNEIYMNKQGSPALLLHGLFMAGDSWFLDSTKQSLGFILADNGFDVWVGNVRGTRWSHGHISLSEENKEFWDWSWQELALFDVGEMIDYISSITNMKVYIVGHSQGTIISFAALTQPNIVEKVEAAALLCPISYLDHVSAPLVLRMSSMHLDSMILAMGFHQLNFRSNWGINLLDSICDDIACHDLLTSITGKNCCFNDSRIDFYLEYEPHPSSAKNLHHLFQMIRKGTFAKYDYGIFKNLKEYGQLKPPAFDLGQIPKSLPIWMAYGGNDALADTKDMEHTIKELQSKPELLYLENYGHIDFIVSVNGKEDIYDHMVSFFWSLEQPD